MKSISTTAMIALMAATLGVSAVAPAFAQDAPPPAEQVQPADPGQGFRHGPDGRGLGGLLGFEHGVEGVEIALVRLSHAIEMTDEQQALFDTLRTDVLAAAETFEEAIEPLRPAAPAAGEVAAMPDFSERLENRIALGQAQLAALEAVQPSVAAFFDSLTDEQKAQLTPQRPEGGFGRHGMEGRDGHRPGGRPMAGPNRG